jgi:hypothetical protein
VAGRFAKFRGRLVGVDVERLLAELTASRDGLFARAGKPLDVVG